MVGAATNKQVVSAELTVEIQQLRDVIPHATKVGAVQTNITIELLGLLLAAYDKKAGGDRI